MEETLLKFFEKYQERIEEFKFDRPFVLLYDIKGILKNAGRNGLIYSLMRYTNVTDSTCQVTGDFGFLNYVKNNKKVFVFGSSYSGYDYALNKQTGEIVTIEIDGDEIYFPVAKDELSFLKVQIELIEFDSLFKPGIKVEAQTSQSYRRKCIEIAGGEKYAKLYNYTVISQDDQPDGLFKLVD